MEMTWGKGSGELGSWELFIAPSAKPVSTFGKWSQTGHESQCVLASEKAVALSPLDSAFNSGEQHLTYSHPGIPGPEEAVPIRASYQATHPTHHSGGFSFLLEQGPVTLGSAGSQFGSNPTPVRHF